MAGGCLRNLISSFRVWHKLCAIAICWRVVENCFGEYLWNKVQSFVLTARVETFLLIMSLYIRTGWIPSKIHFNFWWRMPLFGCHFFRFEYWKRFGSIIRKDLVKIYEVRLTWGPPSIDFTRNFYCSKRLLNVWNVVKNGF